MKSGILLIGVALLCAMPVRADMAEQMKSLPDKIVVSNEDDTLNFRKGTRSDSFFVFEDKVNGNRYRQTYQNSVCLASVTYQPANIGRMSNAKVKRRIKELTKFQVSRQDSYRLGAHTFFMNAGSTPEQAVILMLAGKENALIKVDMVCQALPYMNERANMKSAIFWAKELATTASTTFNPEKGRKEK